MSSLHNARHRKGNSGYECHRVRSTVGCARNASAICWCSVGLMWSLGGTIARFIAIDDNWSWCSWRSLWAAAFLIAFMAWRDGPRGTVKLFGMGLPGLAVAVCFAPLHRFVVALAYTKVANILLITGRRSAAGGLAELALVSRESLGRHLGGDRRRHRRGRHHGLRSLGGAVSPIGDGLALLIAHVFRRRVSPGASHGCR